MIDTKNETLSEWMVGANKEAEQKMDDMNTPADERMFYQGYCEFIDDILPNVRALERVLKDIRDMAKADIAFGREGELTAEILAAAEKALGES